MKDFIERFCDEKAKYSFYLEFSRRKLLLSLIEEYVPKGDIVVDLGAQPFIVSCASRLMGYEVIAYDYDPEPYLNIAKTCGVKVVKCDLEQDSLGMEDESADCVVFSEVIEHINPYYVTHVMAEINRVLKVGGKLIITTPNIASLFRRIKLLVGMQPQYRLHIHEYTKRELEDLLSLTGFRIIDSFYSDVCDLTYISCAKKEDYLKLKNYRGLLKIMLEKPTKTNILRALAYPIVRIMPTLRMLVVVIAEKESNIGYRKPAERW